MIPFYEVRITRLLPPPVFFSTKGDASGGRLEDLAKEQVVQEVERLHTNSGSFNILVMQGKIKHPVLCRLDFTISDIKQQVQRIVGVSLHNQKLIFKGRQLKDDDSVSGVGIKADDKVLLMISAEGLQELKAKSEETTITTPFSFDLNTLLIGANPWTCSPGMCFLPKWVMNCLGVADGDMVEIEPLQPPLNTSGHAMARGMDPRDHKSKESLERGACCIEISDLWCCGQSKKNVRGVEEVCAPPRACPECWQAQAYPNLNGGLREAARVAWRILIKPSSEGAGFEELVRDGPKFLLDKGGLRCIQSGMTVPLIWASEDRAQKSILIQCEGILDTDSHTLAEAALTPHTEHSFMECESRADEKRMEPRTSKSGMQLWRKLALAVRTSSIFMSSIDDALLMGEMVSDYLEQATSDDADRNLIRQNEFGWLLKNKISVLEEEGNLPPRFQGLATGCAALDKRSRCEPDAEPPKRRLTMVKVGDSADMEADSGEGEEEFYSKLPVPVQMCDFDAMDADKDGFCTLEELEAVLSKSEWNKEQIRRLFKAIDVKKEGRISREAFRAHVGGRSGSTRRLVRLWLRRKLYDEVQEQAFAFSRGLREVVPVGLLSLFSAAELQCLLGGGPSVDSAALDDWKRHCEYDPESRHNGLHAGHERVAWFWAAVDAMSCTERADVWKYATGLSRPPPAHKGGCGSLVPKFNLVALRSDDKIDDGALVNAATCHNQLQLPRYSSAEVTAQQLLRSVQEGLAGVEEPDSFEAVRRRLLPQTLPSGGSESKRARAGLTQEVLRSLFSNSYMCGKCGFGPVEHHHCADLRSHHGQEIGAGRISNACPKCGWFSPKVLPRVPFSIRSALVILFLSVHCMHIFCRLSKKPD